MTSTRTKRENICDECGLPISICNAKAMFEQALIRNGREAVIAAILDTQTEQTEQPTPDPVERLVEAARAMRSAICGPDGFANSVRLHSGLAYPWPALEIAESLMDAALAAMEDDHD